MFHSFVRANISSDLSALTNTRFIEIFTNNLTHSLKKNNKSIFGIPACKLVLEAAFEQLGNIQTVDSSNYQSLIKAYINIAKDMQNLLNIHSLETLKRISVPQNQAVPMLRGRFIEIFTNNLTHSLKKNNKSILGIPACKLVLEAAFEQLGNIQTIDSNNYQLLVEAYINIAKDMQNLLNIHSLETLKRIGVPQSHSVNNATLIANNNNTGLIANNNAVNVTPKKVDLSRNFTQTNIGPFTVSCISIEGYDLSKSEILEKELKDEQGCIVLKKFKRFTKVEIRHLLEVALLNGHDSLALGALSYGDFCSKDNPKGLTARLASQAYEEVLKEPAYCNRFKNVTFAVYSMGDQSQYSIFKDIVQKFNEAEVENIMKLNQFQGLMSITYQNGNYQQHNNNVSINSNKITNIISNSKKMTISQESGNLIKNKVKALLNIFENDLQFFNNLPVGSDKDLVKEAVENALEDKFTIDKFLELDFVRIAGKNGREIIDLYFNALAVASDILHQQDPNALNNNTKPKYSLK